MQSLKNLRILSSQPWKRKTKTNKQETLVDATCSDLTAFQFHVGVKGRQKEDLHIQSFKKKKRETRREVRLTWIYLFNTLRCILETLPVCFLFVCFFLIPKRNSSFTLFLCGGTSPRGTYMFHQTSHCF